MSLRMLKKVLEEKEKSNSQLEFNRDDNSASDSESTDSHRRVSNLFDVLDIQEDADEEDAGDDNPDNNKDEPTGMVSLSKNAISMRSHKKKKNKKKAVPLDTSKNDASSNIWEGISSEQSDLISSYNTDSKPEKSVGPSNLMKGKGISQKQMHILSVDEKHVRAEDELRRLFGSKVVNAKETNKNKGRQRQRQGLSRAGHNFYLKKSILVVPSDTWPRWDHCLSMDLLEAKDGLLFFRYAHSSSYLEAQRNFEAAQSMHDMNAIALVLARHPYHVESLLVLADMFKYAGDHERSVDTIERCLYALECAWHPQFNPARGNCRLDYVSDANKPFFMALQRHIQNLNRRGCCRSALEVCKLLLSLNSDDPLGALFSIDYFALRSQQYEWLERFSDEYVSDNSIFLLPNFSFSLAVARFYLENDLSRAQSSSQTEKISSTELLKQALMLHPLVLKKLVEKTPLKEAVWQQILKNPHFGKADAGSPSLEHLIQIYVERNYLIWRLPELQKLLKDAAFEVIEMVRQEKSEIKDWACVRKEIFTSGKNEFSHLLISDFSDSIPSIPPEEMQHLIVGQPVGNANPDAVIAQHEQQGAGNIHGRNALYVFLESLLPWVDHGSNAHGVEQRDQEHHEGEN